MPTYDPAPPEVIDLIALLIDTHPLHADLKEAGVTVGAVMSSAVKHHGWPALAVVKINGTRARVEGLPDATITIDRPAWDDAGEAQQRALIAHELHHLSVKRKDLLWQYDDNGRPKLVMRPHNWELGGFEAIAELYGEDAPEVRGARAMADRFGQLLFEWGDERAGGARGRSPVSGPTLAAAAV